ncbi:MAG: EamA family transporter [Alphaproteobacteria bacterium]|nr:EamA family transporter [Alphaproteobacteria bacterium]
MASPATPALDAPRPGNARAIAFLTLSNALFVSSDTCVKLATEHLPTSQIMGLRGILATLGVMALAASMGAFRRLRPALTPGVALRSGLEAALSLTYVVILPLIALGDLAAIVQTTPLIMTALAAIFLGEHVGIRRWTAILIGFAGVLLIAKPGGATTIPALMALGIAFMVAIRDLLTRRLDPQIPSILLTAFATAAVAIAAWMLAPFETWVAVPPHVWAYLVGSGILLTSANYCVITAYRDADIAAIAPFRYTAVVFALILGFLVWHEIPDLWAAIGIAAIAGAGVYTLERSAWRLRRRP